MAETGADRPSKKQRDLLLFIDGFIKGHGYGPSYREIMRALNYKSVSTVAIHVDNLITKGKLMKRDRSARSLVVVDDSVSTYVAGHEQKVSAAQERWLVGQVNARFDAYETTPSEKVYDELCILVGSLKILGLEDAARAAKARLRTVRKLSA